MIGFYIGSIYYVILNILDYLKYDTTTSIYEINEKETEFPTISFCCADDPNFEPKIISSFFQNEDLTQKWQNHFESYKDLTYGKCFRFNSGKDMSNHLIPIKKSKISGLISGFWLDLFFNSTFDDVSLMIYIHNYTQMPETIFNKGHYIQSGSRNYFNIKRKIDQKLEFPYNNCFKNVSESSKYNQTIIDYLKEKKRQYSQKECLNLCINLKYHEINACNFTIDNLDKDVLNTAYDNLND